MNTVKGLIAVFGLLAGFALSATAQTELATLDGNRIDIQSQRGKVVVLAVGASWLPLSAKQADFTNQLAKKYAGRDVAIYFVATDSAASSSKNFATTGDIRKFAASRKLSVPVLRDPDGAATVGKFTIDQLPSFVIIDKQGNQAGEAIGGIDPKFDITVPIGKQVDALLN